MIVGQPLFKRVLPISFLLIGLIALVVLAQSITSRLSDLRQAPTDNLTWTLSQVEIEVLLVADAASVTPVDEEVLKNVRRRFNSLFSRVTQLEKGAVFADMRQDKQFKTLASSLNASLTKLVSFVDSSDAELVQNLPAVVQELRTMRLTAHDVALVGIRLQAESTDKERSDFSSLLVIAAILSATLIGVSALTAYFLYRQHKKASEITSKVERASTRLKSSFDTSLDAIIVANSKGEITEFNDAAETVFGFTSSEVIGKEMVDLIVPTQYRDAHRMGMARFNATKIPKLVGQGRIEITALKKDGTEFQIEIAIGHGEENDQSIFVAYIRDITDRLAAEKELRIARDEALEAGKAKSNFLAVMSHEMRTPLNGLFGTIELLKETKLTKKQSGFLQLAQSSSDILLHHVNDVLDVSRLEAAKLELTPRSFDLKEFFEDVITTNQTTANARQNELFLTFGEMPSRPVWMDDHRLKQVAFNLIGNAIKFTKNGQVTIKAFLSKPNELTFSVTDTGIGISEENIDHIFEEFYTQEQSYDRVASGAGLGLSICGRIVDLMKGQISVTSTLNRGSKFTVKLPLVFSDKEQTEQIEDVEVYDVGGLQGLDILLVEDNEINRQIVREMLEKDGVKITEAINGKEAVELAQNHSFDVILMDVSMPVMNGVDATLAIRKSDGLSKKKPILGLTAHALQEEQTKFLAAGMNACLNKPVSHKQLAQNIVGLVLNKEIEIQSQEPENGILNLDTNRQVRTALGTDKYTKIVDDFEREIHDLIEAIPNLLANKDYNKLASLTHRSVGSSGMIGAAELQDRLRNLEAAAKEQDSVKFSKSLAKLPKLVKRTFEHLRPR